MTDEIRWAWIAGIIEGEGCFGITAPSRGRNTANGRIVVNMTDGDVILRLKEWAQRGTVSGPRARPKGCKPIWTWTVSRCEDVLYVIQRVSPYLLSRRADRAAQLAALMTTKRPKALHQSLEEKREKKRLRARRYYAANRDSRNEYMRQWMRKRRAESRASLSA